MIRRGRSWRRRREGFGDSVWEGVAIGIAVAFALAGALFAESTTSRWWFVVTAAVLVTWPFVEGFVTRRVRRRFRGNG